MQRKGTSVSGANQEMVRITRIESADALVPALSFGLIGQARAQTSILYFDGPKVPTCECLVCFGIKLKLAYVSSMKGISLDWHIDVDTAIPDRLGKGRCRRGSSGAR